MITIGYSTKKENPNFTEYLKNTCGLKDVQIIEIINPGLFSLTEAYNKILDLSINEVVVFTHDDILFEKEYWGKRIIEHFDKKPEYGILGVAGTTYYPSSGRWWEIQGEMIGQVYHQHQGKKWLSEYNKPFGSKIIDSVIVDGLFFSIKKSNIKERFDESVKGFHFYDTTFCIQNFLSGVKIGTISNVPLTHLSIGETNEQWEVNRQNFVDKYQDRLPIKVKNVYPILPINPKIPLVSVVIPIYNYGIQFEKTLCSIFESTYKNLEIIIVDDGSNLIQVLLLLEITE